MNSFNPHSNLGALLSNLRMSKLVKGEHLPKVTRQVAELRLRCICFPRPPSLLLPSLPLLALRHSSFSARDIYRGPPALPWKTLFLIRSVVDRITAFLPRMLQMKLHVDCVMPVDLSNVSS